MFCLLLTKYPPLTLNAHTAITITSAAQSITWQPSPYQPWQPQACVSWVSQPGESWVQTRSTCQFSVMPEGCTPAVHVWVVFPEGCTPAVKMSYSVLPQDFKVMFRLQGQETATLPSWRMRNAYYTVSTAGNIVDRALVHFAYGLSESACSRMRNCLSLCKPRHCLRAP